MLKTYSKFVISANIHTCVIAKVRHQSFKVLETFDL